MNEDQSFKSYGILSKCLNLSDSQFTHLKIKYIVLQKIIMEINVNIQKASSVLPDTVLYQCKFFLVTLYIAI